MNDISFTEALGIAPGITAIIGGGGKTSLMNRLAAELSAAGSRVIICTSTTYGGRRICRCWKTQRRRT